MIRAGIIGATGYAGAEIVRILAAHPEAEIAWLGSRSFAERPYNEVYGNFYNLIDLSCIDDDTESMKEKIGELAEQVDVIFTATPQGACASFISSELLKKVKIIDLSADFRLKDVSIYEKWYKIEHKAPGLIRSAVYGLCEINREEIKRTSLVANPGCYTTCSILTAYPLVQKHLIDADTLIIDAMSGVSGAGRGAKTANLFCEVNENAKAYGVTSHRHTPEIEEQLGYASGSSVTVQFTPHLVPMNRGILATEYADLSVTAPDGRVLTGREAAKEGMLPSEEELLDIYREFYKGCPFVRILRPGTVPETRFVEGSNYVDIGLKVDKRTGRVILMGALDNLVKGAAGQAVQNMNLLFGLPETTGLLMPPVFP